MVRQRIPAAIWVLSCAFAVPVMAATAPASSNYILYRTTDYVVTPAPYTDPVTKSVVTPEPFVASRAGTVILAQQIADSATVSVPAGFALVTDPDGKHPVGSIYTPPAP